MITKLNILLLIALLAVNGSASAYSVSWWTVDSGGGNSAGGGFSIDGTAGQPDTSMATLNGGNLSVMGGLWGFEPSISPPPWGGRIWLPVVQQRPCSANSEEQEPNNTVSQANRVCLGIPVYGTHDGSAGTGDLFYAQMHSVAGLQVSLDTTDAAGVQLLLYRTNGDTLELVAQDAVPPFEIVLVTNQIETYYAYAYSDPSHSNTASYSLLVNNMGGRAVSETPSLAPTPTPPPPPARQP